MRSRADSRRRFMALGGAAFGGLVAVRRPARAAQFELRCGATLPIDHPASVRQIQMWNAIRKESGGRIVTRYFPSSQLGGDAALLSQLRLGALDFFLVSPAILSTVVPGADVTFLGFAYKSAEEVLRVMDGPVGGFVREEAAAKGMYVLQKIWDSGMAQTTSGTHPIRTPDDLHGFKIALNASRLLIGTFQALGASTSTISLAEYYTALQTKLVDGITAPLVSIQTQRFFEVQKYVSLTNHAWSGFWLAANADRWKSFPPDLQEIVERNNAAFATVERRDARLMNLSVADKLQREGMGINQLDQNEFRARLHAYYQNWAGVYGARLWDLLETSLGRKLG